MTELKLTENKRDSLRDKIRRQLDKYCDTIELLLAISVGLVLIFTAVTYFLTVFGVLDFMRDTGWFQEFLHNVFTLVVGIEFIKMLLKPSSENVIEVLVFLVTRYLIIDHSSALGIFACVSCIILLYGFHFFLQFLKAKYDILSAAIDADASDIGGVDDDDSDLGEL